MKKEKELLFRTICQVCGFITVAAVASISIYLLVNGLPAIREIGFKGLLLNGKWEPTAQSPSFGILYVIISSICVTLFSVALSVPIGILASVFLTNYANKRAAYVLSSVVDLLASIPSVIYGLIGMMVVNKTIYKVELMLFAGSGNHQFTGGANFLSAIIVLVVMIMPTIISVSVSSIKSVDKNLYSASLALGATKIQSIFKVVLVSAKSGIVTGVVLAIGRALGEAMAVNMVSGGSVNLPLPFNSVRFLTTQIVSEMSYSEGLHRQVLYTVGLVLYAFILIVNGICFKVKKVSKNNE